VKITPGDAGASAGGPQLMSVTEAARVLGISRTLAYDLAARQELPSVRFGNRIHVLRRAVVCLVGASGDEFVLGAGARATEQSTRQRTEAPARSVSAARRETSPKFRTQPRQTPPRGRHPESPTQLTLFEPTHHPTSANPTEPPSPRPHRSSTHSSSPTSQPHPCRELPPSNQPDALAPGVQRGRVNVAGNRAGDRSALNENLNGEVGSPC